MIAKAKLRSGAWPRRGSESRREARSLQSRCAVPRPRRLCNHAASDTSPATAQWLRLIAVIVAADMDPHRSAAQYRHILDMRRDLGLRRVAVACYLQHRQIAEMAVPCRSLMLAGMLRVEMTAGSTGWHRLAVFGGRLAGTVL